jgi:hypothetical protein
MIPVPRTAQEADGSEATASHPSINTLMPRSRSMSRIHPIGPDQSA